MDLFEQHRNDFLKSNAPLADRMRPVTLDQFIGQEHIIGPGRLLRRAIQIDQLSSLIFFGPPGTGKTTLARIIANTTRAQFLMINAVLAGIADIRNAIKQAQESLALHSRRTILFIDEVHRFNKAQQDALLPHVENGTLILIGATTENPYFEVNKALVSRSRIFQLKPLTNDDLEAIAVQALTDKERGYGAKPLHIDKDALQHLIQVANGDARGVLNALELAVETTPPQEDGTIIINRAVAEDSIQKRAVLYDKDGDSHYDTISAFIKSLRGSDPDAALYWMAKMLYAGENPRFIFRRMLILACEDIGLADPHALQVVVSAAQAFEHVGEPEGRFHLAHACLYCATAPKSNSAMAFFDALSTVEKEREGEVPNHLKDASRDKEGFGHGKGYLYPHAFRDHWVVQQYLPAGLQGKLFYDPSDQGYEASIQQKVMARRESQIEAMVSTDDHHLGGDDGGMRQGTGSTQAVWEKRTSGTTSDIVSNIRDTVLDLAQIREESLVVDLYAKTGLLGFEALRRAHRGDVYLMTHDKESFDTVTMFSGRFSPLHRPQVLPAASATLIQDIRNGCGNQVFFDAIVGRNVLSLYRDKVDFIRTAVTLLRNAGTLALAETVHRRSQRLSSLVLFDDASFTERFCAAESALFDNKDDLFVNWDVETLNDGLAALSGSSVTVRTTAYSARRRISPADVDHWCRVSTKPGRPALGDYLNGRFNKEEFSRLVRQMHGCLDNTEVQWKSAVCFICLKRQSPDRR